MATHCQNKTNVYSNVFIEQTRELFFVFYISTSVNTSHALKFMVNESGKDKDKT